MAHVLQPGLISKAQEEMGENQDGKPEWEAMMEELATRLFAAGGKPSTQYFDHEDLGLEKNRLFFEHLYTCGDSVLAGKVTRRRDGTGALDLLPTPWAPVNLHGTTGADGASPASWPCPAITPIRPT